MGSSKQTYEVFDIITIMYVKRVPRASFCFVFFIIENKSKVGKDFPKYTILQVEETCSVAKGTMDLKH